MARFKIKDGDFDIHFVEADYCEQATPFTPELKYPLRFFATPKDSSGPIAVATFKTWCWYIELHSRWQRWKENRTR